MPKTGKKTYYWDSCAFIAWIDGGKGHPVEVIAGLDEIAREVTDNKANLCTNVITQPELLKGKLSPDQITKLDNLFKRKNVIQINLDGRIAKRASEIRDYYNSKGTKISTPDSIHLATAIIYEVDEFHTLDGAGERARRSDLLSLNGDVAGSPLHIRVPRAQPSLFSAVEGNINNGRERAEESITQTAQPSSAEIQGGGDRSSEGETTKTEIDKKETG